MGMRWVIQERFSDEFEGDELDLEKWNNFHPRWKGRAPAKFVKEAVSVKDGLMRIKNGVLPEPDGPYSLFGGAVTSKTDGAHFGYYECRFKASQVKMSTTFWLSGGGGDCLDTEVEGDAFWQELDIQECVGGSVENPAFREQMHANTHFWYTPPGQEERKSYSRGARIDLDSEVWEDFHTYGAWWVDSTYARFYADDEFFEAVHFFNEIIDEPMPYPMQINMVTETYNWQPPPTAEELADDSNNTSYYDWIRSYKLVPMEQETGEQSYSHPVFGEEIQIYSISSPKGNKRILELEFIYKANTDRIIQVDVLRWNGKNKKSMQKESSSALAGYGRGRLQLVLGFEPGKNEALSLKVSLCNGTEILDSKSESVVLKQ